MNLSFRTGGVVGVALFGIGTFLRMYMLYRIEGMDSFSSTRMVEMRRYRDLVAQGKAPFWPIPVCHFFWWVGFIVTLTAILILK